MNNIFSRLLLLFVMVPFLALSQHLPEPVASSGIYEFVDELATTGLISVNSAVKPYGREVIAAWLIAADAQRDKLNRRQQADLGFYLKEFVSGWQQKRYQLLPGLTGDAGVYPTSASVEYNDSLFHFVARPLAGYQLTSNGSENLTRSYWGFSVAATAGNNWSAWASLRDNHESEAILKPGYFINRPGVPLKNSPNGGVDYSEMNGGVVYSWKWGSVGLVKDHVVWGNNRNGSNILSGNTPGFAHLALKVKPARWLELNYIHGWLVSNVVDSARSFYDDYVYRVVLRPKYIAANLITITPFRRLDVSFGNSVIYSDQNVHPAYLIPIFFYKSVDHTLNNTNSTGESGQNAQLFFDISSRQINHLHLFVAAYFDELHINRIKEGLVHNFFSLKPGFRLDGWPLAGLSLEGEYTLTKPLAYQHKISTTRFTSNDYNLGHYLRDNSKELYLAVRYKPMRGLSLTAWMTEARHYNNYLYSDRQFISDDPPFKDLTWSRTEFGLRGSWELAYNSYLFFSVSRSETKGYEADGKSAAENLKAFTPEFYRGKLTLLNAGFAIGF